MNEDYEEDLMRLRNEALKTMGQKTNPTAGHNRVNKDNSSETSRSQRTDTAETKTRTKTSEKSGHTRTNNNYRNGCTRSNLIVLTQSNESVKGSEGQTFNKLVNRTDDRESPQKQKKVLPGRFNRRDSDESDEDSDDDVSDVEDDDQIPISAELANNCGDDNEIKADVKSRLTLNSDKRHNSDERSDRSHRNDRNDRTNREAKRTDRQERSERTDRTDREDKGEPRHERRGRSRRDSIDDQSSQSVKRLRSFVVIK